MPYLESLMKCIEMQWMAILVGPAGCGKTSLVRWLANATGNKLVEFSMNSGVDTSEILGGFEQVDLQRHRTALLRLMSELVAEATLLSDYRSSEQVALVSRISALYHRAAADLQQNDGEGQTGVAELCALAEEIAQGADCFESLVGQANEVRRRAQAFASLEVAGKFEWVDGILVDALINGYWLLIDRANLCSASVLDRLNGLLEPNGVLYVNEDPKRTEAIVPHPNFRIVMAVDPQYGELSRAMRNRGIEICMLPPQLSSSSSPASSDNIGLVLSDQRVVAAAIGMCPELLRARVAPEATMTALVQQAMHITERVQRGYVAEIRDLEDEDELMLVRAPDSPGDAAVALASWQAALTQVAASQPSGATATPLVSSRMLLAVLNTLPPNQLALSTLCFRAIIAESSSSELLYHLMGSSDLADAIVRARELLASESGVHAEMLAVAPVYIALNRSLHRTLARHQHHQDAEEGPAALWHRALSDTLMFQRERMALEFITPVDSDDLRELVLQRPNVDIGFVQSIFALIDGCQQILDGWVPALVAADQTTVMADMAQFVPALRTLHQLKLRIQRLLSYERGAASELAVAFENLQPTLASLALVPGEVGSMARMLLEASVDGLVLDASHSAKVWALVHPVTLSDHESRVLESRLNDAAVALAKDPESDPAAREAVVEALAMLYATASRKDQHLVRAAISRFAQTLPTESSSIAPSSSVTAAQSAPADVIADIVELTAWNDIVQMADISGSLAADNTAREQLHLLVRNAVVSENSPWTLLFTRLNWTLNDHTCSASNAPLQPLLTDLTQQWYRSLDSRSFDALLYSPSLRLWQPVATELTWKQAEQFDCALADHERATKEGRDLLRALATYHPHARSSADELALLVARIVQAARAVSVSDTDISDLARCSQQVIECLRSGHAADPTLVGEWIEKLQTATAPVADAVALAVDSMRAALLASASSSLVFVYRAWIEVRLCILSISIPRRPVDPAAKARTQWTWLGSDIEVARGDLVSYQAIQRTMTGESDTVATQPFAAQLAALEREQAGIELVYRPSAKDRSDDGHTTSFAELWQEAHNLALNVFGRVRDISAQLMPTAELAAASGDDAAAAAVDDFALVQAAAQSLLGTLEQFENRVVKRYFAAFRDVAQIWCTQVRQVSYGLARLVELRRLQVHVQTRQQAQTVSSLYAQPMGDMPMSAQSQSQLQRTLAQLKTLVYFTPGSNALKIYGQLLVALLTRTAFGVQVRGSLGADDLTALDMVFRDAYEIHRRAVEEQRKRDAEAASLFKSKVTKEPTDEELLNEIFPGFEDIYEAQDGGAEDDKEPSYQDLSEETVAALAACHQYVMLQFGGMLHGASDVRRAQIADAQRQAFELAASLYQLKPELASLQTAGADSELRGANLVALAAMATAAASSSAATATSSGGRESGVRQVQVYNFYKDPSISEAVLLTPLVLAIAKRTEFLLEEWPDHA
ncbi:AAA ATPase midasin, partial [Kickxella alabastrina]